MFPLCEIEAVKIHDFVPRLYEIMQKLFFGILTCVDFRKSTEL
jgi:hypothetical protein